MLVCGNLQDPWISPPNEALRDDWELINDGPSLPFGDVGGDQPPQDLDSHALAFDPELANVFPACSRPIDAATVCVEDHSVVRHGRTFCHTNSR